MASVLAYGRVLCLSQAVHPVVVAAAVHVVGCRAPQGRAYRGLTGALLQQPWTTTGATQSAIPTSLSASVWLLFARLHLSTAILQVCQQHYRHLQHSQHYLVHQQPN